MSCCAAHCEATDAKFGKATAQADLARYRKRGPDPTTRHIIRAIRNLHIQQASLLDVGGGIGIIQHELIGDVFRSATLVEASAAYLDVARSQSTDPGTSHSTRYLHGDFAHIAHEIPEADVVTLDRVVCCYPDYARLLSTAAAQSKVACVISYPRNRWFVRLVFKLQNFGRRLTGDTFRTFVHSADDMDRVVVGAGLALHESSDELFWRVVVYTRTEVMGTKDRTANRLPQR